MQNYVTLNLPDGSTMACYTALPADTHTEAPGLILLQEAFGVNHHIKDVAERFAAQGYVVIAPELFHRTAPVGFEAEYGNFPSVMPHYQAITDDGLQTDLQACYNWLNSHQQVVEGNISSIGYCLGGKVSFMANAWLPLKAAVSYYGGGLAQKLDMAPQLHGKHLFVWGGLDKHITQEMVFDTVKAMDTTGKPFANIKFSYADHGFFCDARPSYNASAAAEAWALTLAFLKS